MNITVKDHREWVGEYRGVSFAVCRWRNGEKGNPYDMGYIWNYYVYVKPRRMRTVPGFRKGTRNMDYARMYPDVNFHGGITYMCEIREGIDADTKFHKIGCDYGHSYDMKGSNPIMFIDRELEDILRDVKATIDTLPKDLIFAHNKTYNP